jgi:hypothetical protein
MVLADFEAEFGASTMHSDSKQLCCVLRRAELMYFYCKQGLRMDRVWLCNTLMYIRIHN